MRVFQRNVKLKIENAKSRLGKIFPMPDTKKGGGGLKGVREIRFFRILSHISSQTIRVATWVFATQKWSISTQGLPKSVRVNTIGTIIYIGLNICFFTVFFIVAISEFQKPASEYMNRNLMWTYQFSSWYILSNIISNHESQLYPTIKK